MGQDTFWIAALKIIWINALLSGDNAVAIAMACRALPKRQHLWGIVLGVGIAMVLQVAFASIVTTLMTLPYLKLVGGVALFYVAAKLLVPERRRGDGIVASDGFWHAARVVAVADIVMSLDNVIATAAAAHGNIRLLALGLAVSVPLIAAGASLILATIDRFPILLWAGAALLGWIVGEAFTTDPAIAHYLAARFTVDHVQQIMLSASLLGAVGTVAAGAAWRLASQAATTAPSRQADGTP